MKKLYLFILIAACFTFTLQAQPTLTYQNNAPQIGDVFEMQIVDAENLIPGPDGANVTWDFSVLTNTGVMQVNAVDPATTGYGGDFPEANIAMDYLTGVYSFGIGNTTGFYDVGMVADTGGGEALLIHYTDSRQFMSYPFTYNNSFLDTYYAEYTLVADIIVNGNMTITADAYGTLILPTGTVNNVLRIKNITTEIDSFFFATIFVYANIINREDYTWYTDSYNNPIFNIHISDLNGTISKSAYYSEGGSSIEDLNLGLVSDLRVYPNPASDHININFELAEASDIRLSIFNQLGQQVWVMNKVYDLSGTQSENIEIGQLPRGIYYLYLSGKDQYSASSKLLIR
ncbi:MAG: T9SS type A sorting domain-containing protein [Bacteroidetes bacterium]|nr:T9SS type A sorting domain-containing protein [Bacteroidota bacterium]